LQKRSIQELEGLQTGDVVLPNVEFDKTGELNIGDIPENGGLHVVREPKFFDFSFDDEPEELVPSVVGVSSVGWVKDKITDHPLAFAIIEDFEGVWVDKSSFFQSGHGNEGELDVVNAFAPDKFDGLVVFHRMKGVLIL
jgi:hypothetical protein